MKQFRFLVLSVAALTLCATTLVAQNAPQTDTEDKVLYLLDGKVVEKNHIENLPDYMIKDINVIENTESVVMVNTYTGEVIDRITGVSSYDHNTKQLSVYINQSDDFKLKEHFGDQYVINVDLSKPFPERNVVVVGYGNETMDSLKEKTLSGIKYDDEGRVYIDTNGTFPDRQMEVKMPAEVGEPLIIILDKDGKSIKKDIRDIKPEQIKAITFMGPGTTSNIYGGEEGVLPAGMIHIQLY